MNNRNRKYSIYLPIAFAIILVIGIWLGSILGPGHPQGSKIFPSSSSSYSKVNDIFDYIVRDYVDTVDIDAMESDAIKGMLEVLDPHSSYISASDFHAVKDPLLGSFEGIGISFRIEKDTITVINPIPGGPSEKVGLMARAPNPYDPDKQILIFAGFRCIGSKTAVMGLTRFPDLVLQKFDNDKVFAALVDGYDSDSDGKIDTIELIE